MAKVDIVRVKNGPRYNPEFHHAVEEEGTHKVIHECGTQADAIAWAKDNGHVPMNIHRERVRKDGDQHGQFR